MKASIITVSYNSAATIRDTIESVLSQLHDEVEYIIIDGGSTDDTLGIIEEYGNRIHRLVSEPDEGLYHAMNKGVSLATGEVIGILNSDDLYMDDRVLEDVMQAFETAPIDAVYGDLVYVKEDDLDKVVRYWRSGAYDRSAFLNGWMPPHPTFFVKKEMYDRFGSYDTSFTTSADYELMLRFLYKNHLQADYVGRVLVKMRAGGQSNASMDNRVRANKEDRRAWQVNGLKPRAYTLSLKPIRKIGQYFQKYRLN